MKTLTLVNSGNYRDNIANVIGFANTINVNTTTNRSGQNCVVNVIMGISTLTVTNSGSFINPPTTLTLVNLVGGSGIGANCNLNIDLQAHKSGGTGWVQKIQIREIGNRNKGF